jgi:hypothetical protein
VPLFMPFIKVLSTPKRAARMVSKVLINASGQTGVYYDERGDPMPGSTLVRDPTLQDRVVASRSLAHLGGCRLPDFASGVGRQRKIEADPPPARTMLMTPLNRHKQEYLAATHNALTM